MHEQTPTRSAEPSACEKESSTREKEPLAPDREPSARNKKPSASVKPSLESLLRRGDVWRGHSQTFVASRSLDTGFTPLNAALLNQGWPEGCLVELGQPNFAASWVLFAEPAKLVSGASPTEDAPQGIIALLNPPAMPYAVGLLQLGIPLERLLVVSAEEKSDFIACFVELARSPACAMVLSWQPKKKLSYTELRKCQLATHEQAGLYVLFRHHSAFSQSSPAALRIQMRMQEQSLKLEFVKQKGKLQSSEVVLDLPATWFDLPDYKNLNLEFKPEKKVAYNTAQTLEGRVVSISTKRTRKI